MWESIYLIHPANPVLTLLLFLLYLIWIELRRAREARGWTAEEAAEHLNIDTRTYSGWERREHRPRGLNHLTLQRTFPKLDFAQLDLTPFGLTQKIKRFRRDQARYKRRHTDQLLLLDHLDCLIQTPSSAKIRAQFYQEKRETHVSVEEHLNN